MDKKIEKLDIKNSNLPLFMIEQYDVLFDMFKTEQYYGVLYQAKDFLELFIKLPVVVLAARLVDFIQNTEDIDKLNSDDVVVSKKS